MAEPVNVKPHGEFIKRVEAGIQTDNAGFSAFCTDAIEPCQLSAWALRSIADELDRRNGTWQAELDRRELQAEAEPEPELRSELSAEALEGLREVGKFLGNLFIGIISPPGELVAKDAAIEAMRRASSLMGTAEALLKLPPAVSPRVIAARRRAAQENLAEASKELERVSGYGEPVTVALARCRELEGACARLLA